MKKKILLIFVFAFIIRLIALNQSFWLDEGTTARVISHYSFWEIITKFSPGDFHPPLYYLFMKFWSNLFGYSVISLRMPSVLFSLASGWLIYLISGIWPAVFFLFNPLIIYYSQEARMYMATTFFLTVALYYFLKISNIKSKISNSRLKHQILFGLFIFLSLMTFYGSLFLIAAYFIYFLYKKQYKNLLISSFILLVFILTIFPLLLKQLANSRLSLSMVSNWTLVLGKANIKNLLLIPVKFSIGRIDFYPKWIYYSIAGVWTTFVLFQITKIKNNYLFIYLLIFPLFLGFVISFFTPLLQYFRFLFLIPIMSLLLSRSNLRGWILATGFLIFSLAYLLIPQFQREDWKSLASDVKNKSSVYIVEASSDTLKYYDPNLKLNELLNIDKSNLENEITVIPNTVEIYGYDYKKILKEKNYRLIKEKSFRELTLEDWKKTI